MFANKNKSFEQKRVLGQRTRTVSHVQKKMILKFLETNPNLLSGKFSTNFKFSDAQLKWVEISNMLNRVPGGRKGWKDWRKTWHDMRSKTKIKYQQEPNVTLSQIEKEILKLTGELISTKKQAPYQGEFKIKKERDDEFGNEINLDEFLMQNTIPDVSTGTNNMENIIIEYLPSTSNITSEENYEKNVADGAELDLEEIGQMVEKNDLPYFQGNLFSRAPKQKRSYYDRKLIILNRIARAKEKSAVAKERIADALEKLVDIRTSFI